MKSVFKASGSEVRLDDEPLSDQLRIIKQFVILPQFRQYFQIMPFSQKRLKGLLALQFIRLANNKMNNLSTDVVLKFMNQDLWPQVYRALQTRIKEKLIIKGMPRKVAGSIVTNIFDPSLKSATNQQRRKQQEKINQIKDNDKQPEPVKAPKMKNFSKIACQPKQIQSPASDLQGKPKSISRITTQHSSLIKLTSPEQEECEQVKKLRQVKQLMRKHEEFKEMNFQNNQSKNKISAYDKRKALSQCLYHHTYDYQADILNVNPLRLDQENEEQQQKSLLQIIKNNLDKQIMEKKLEKRIKEIAQSQQRQKANKIPACKIDTIQEQNGEYKVKGRDDNITQNKAVVDRSLKPYFKFQHSDIRSLVNNIDNGLSQGVKMITHQQNLVEEIPKLAGQNFKVRHESVVKERPRPSKQKTSTSQSIIYSLEKQLKSDSNINSQVSVIAQSHFDERQQYQSLQMNSQQNEEDYDALTQLLKKHYHSITLDTESRANFIRLPQIQKGSKALTPKKRTTTEHKIIKGLDGIEIRTKDHTNSTPIHFSHRARHFSALLVSKNTESSIQEAQHQSPQKQRGQFRSKTELIRDYFGNYKAQFRQRLRGIQQVINLYG